MTLSNETKYALRAPDGSQITTLIENLFADADLHADLDHNPNAPNDGYHLHYTGTTSCWDTQEPHHTHGETQFIDEHGTVHLAGDVLIVQINADGTETTISKGFNPGIEQPENAAWVATLTPAGQNTRALKYARWITESTHDAELGLIPPHAVTRIHARAHEYAKTEGIHDKLERILKTLEN